MPPLLPDHRLFHCADRTWPVTRASPAKHSPFNVFPACRRRLYCRRLRRACGGRAVRGAAHLTRDLPNLPPPSTNTGFHLYYLTCWPLSAHLLPAGCRAPPSAPRMCSTTPAAWAVCFCSADGFGSCRFTSLLPPYLLPARHRSPSSLPSALLPVLHTAFYPHHLLLSTSPLPFLPPAVSQF